MSRLLFQWLFSAWPKIIIFHSWGMGILLGIYLTATEQLVGCFLWCQGHWFGDGAKLMPEAFFMCKGCFREVLNGRANYTPVNVGRGNPWKQRSKDSNVVCKQGCRIKWERLIVSWLPFRLYLRALLFSEFLLIDINVSATYFHMTPLLGLLVSETKSFRVLAS